MNKYLNPYYFTKKVLNTYNFNSNFKFVLKIIINWVEVVDLQK